ncbi:MAG: ATP-binding protein [Chthoniobacteraceae bacterium]
MGWLAALLVAAVLGGWLWRERRQLRRAEREHARLTRELHEVRLSRDAEAAHLTTILVGMSEGVLVVDGAHVVRMANPSSRELLDLRTDPVGKTVLHAIRAVELDELVTATFAEHKPHETGLSLAHLKPPRHLALDATTIHTESGEDRVLVICRDVTRLRQLEDVRREFVANVSHELRTPLAIFQGYLENLIDHPDLPRPELVDVLAILNRHSTRLNALVEDLLVLARLESSADTLTIEPVEPRRLVEEVVADWKLRAAGKQVRIECSGEAPECEADPMRIGQVLTILVDNAFKYTDAGGCVRVSVAPCADGVEFRVFDTGAGIPPQDLPRIFERFYRADKARSREHGGTGLGLSIAKHIVQQHGGTIRVESTYGKGTTVVLTLPLSQADARSPSDRAPGSDAA